MKADLTDLFAPPVAGDEDDEDGEKNTPPEPDKKLSLVPLPLFDVLV